MCPDASIKARSTPRQIQGFVSNRLLGASEALFSAIGLRGHTYYQFDRSLYERINASVRSALDEAAYEAAQHEHRELHVQCSGDDRHDQQRGDADGGGHEQHG